MNEILLGRLIPVNPQLFLNECRKPNQRMFCTTKVDSEFFDKKFEMCETFIQLFAFKTCQ